MSKRNKKKLSKVQSDFIKLTSHQLRTPLSGTKWLLELLKKDGYSKFTKKQKELVDKIYLSNERMIALVNDILEVSKLESGETKLYLKPTDIATIIRTLVKENESEVKRKHLKISLTIEHEPFPLVITEANKIKQAIGNLITNAILYTVEGGKIDIDLSKQKNHIECSISDTGVGILPNEQKMVFDKFFRGSNTLPFEVMGTGLGLYISKAFIEASGGKIWFDSQVNKGTRFNFTLPIS